MPSHQRISMFVCRYKIPIRCLVLALFACVIISFKPVQAEEKRHHEAHEHGVAHLNIAIDRGSTVERDQANRRGTDRKKEQNIIVAQSRVYRNDCSLSEAYAGNHIIITGH